MAYADAQQVANLCQNIQIGTGGLFDTASAICDAQIDAALGNFFYWPYSSQDVLLSSSLPSYVQVMANLLTAAICENMAYAQMQSKGDMAMDESTGTTTYGRNLQWQYNCMMKSLVKGTVMVNELVRYNSIGARSSDLRFRLQTGLAYDSYLGRGNADLFPGNENN